MFRAFLNSVLLVFLCTALSCTRSSLHNGNGPAVLGEGDGSGGGPGLFQKYSESFFALQHIARLPSVERTEPLSCRLLKQEETSYYRAELARATVKFPFEWVKEDAQDKCIQATDSSLRINESACRKSPLGRTEILDQMAQSLLRTAAHLVPKEMLNCIVQSTDLNFFRYIAANKTPVWRLFAEIGRLRNRPADGAASNDALFDFRLELENGRELLIIMLEKFAQLERPNSVSQEVWDWIGNHRAELIQDVGTSSHQVLKQSSQATCAWTAPIKHSEIKFNPDHCDIGGFTFTEAAEVLLHESSHHAPFLIKDENKAEEIGRAMAAAISESSTLETLDFDVYLRVLHFLNSNPVSWKSGREQFSNQFRALAEVDLYTVLPYADEPTKIRLTAVIPSFARTQAHYALLELMDERVNKTKPYHDYFVIPEDFPATPQAAD